MCYFIPIHTKWLWIYTSHPWSIIEALIGGHVFCIHYVPGIMLNSLHILTHLMLPTTLEVGHSVITLFRPLRKLKHREVKLLAQGDRPSSKWWLRFEARQFGTRICEFNHCFMQEANAHWLLSQEGSTAGQLVLEIYCIPLCTVWLFNIYI